MRKLFSSQLGFSIMELMVGVGIAGGIALVGSQLMSDHVSHKKHLEDKSEINRITQSVKYALADRESCSRNLNTFSGSQTFTTPQNISSVVNSKGGVVVSAPSPQGSYSLESMSIIRNANNQKVLDFVLTFDWGKRKFNNDNRANPALASKIVKRISVFASFDPEVSTWRCGEIMADDRDALKQELCEALGAVAVWDNDLDRCRIKEIKCGPNQVPVMMTSLGSYDCRPTMSTINPNDLINTNVVPCGEGATAQISVVGNRYTITCTGTPTSPPPPACTPSSWLVGPWDTCSSGGTQTRSVICANTECGCTPPAPAASQTCTPPCVPSAWNYGTWSTCSGGTQTRTAFCGNITCGCSGPAVTTQSCFMPAPACCPRTGAMVDSCSLECAHDPYYIGPNRCTGGTMQLQCY